MITDFGDAQDFIYFCGNLLRTTKNIEEGDTGYTSNSNFENVRSGQLYLYIVFHIDPCLLGH